MPIAPRRREAGSIPLLDPAAALLFLPLLTWTIRLGGGFASWCFVDLVNLAFHEAGHLFARPFGSTAGYLGGTLAQLAVPAGLAAWFHLRERRPLGTAACTWWAGESLVNVAVYMADARDLDLPLVGGGDHDWNELFYRWGLLGAADVARVSSSTRAVGLIAMLGGLAWIAGLALPRLRGRPIGAP